MNPLATWYTIDDTMSVVRYDMALPHIVQAYNEAIAEYDAGEDDKREIDTFVADIVRDYL